MKGYGQFCPVAKACEVVGERWTPLILRELLCGSRRFNDIHRGVPLMSPALLSQRLKALERAGVVERRTAGAGRGPEYFLTQAGRELQPIIEQLGVWGHRWVQSHIDDGDLDSGLLMWDMRRRIDVERFPTERIVIAFEFTDAPAGRRSYWLVGDRGSGVEICVTDPGFEVDLYVYADVRTMARVWLGDLGLTRAVESGAVELHGPRHLREGLGSWLGLSLFAGVERGGKPAPAR